LGAESAGMACLVFAKKVSDCSHQFRSNTSITIIHQQAMDKMAGSFANFERAKGY
jgi:hypothetical protein